MKKGRVLLKDMGTFQATVDNCPPTENEQRRKGNQPRASFVNSQNLSPIIPIDTTKELADHLAPSQYRKTQNCENWYYPRQSPARISQLLDEFRNRISAETKPPDSRQLNKIHNFREELDMTDNRTGTELAPVMASSLQ